MEVNLSFRPERAYLEMARCFQLAEAVDADGQEVSPRTSQFHPDDITLALVANAYIMSYTAVIAFVNGQLSRHWESGVLQERYPEAVDFDQLTKKKEYLGDVKKALKELCYHDQKEAISTAERELWHDFKTVVHRARNYYSHPKPYTLDAVVRDSFSKEWDFAPRTAARIIAYFYNDPESPRNEWLWKNQEFKVLKYEVKNPKIFDTGGSN